MQASTSKTNKKQNHTRKEKENEIAPLVEWISLPMITAKTENLIISALSRMHRIILSNSYHEVMYIIQCFFLMLKRNSE
jgi:uncharacterized membrane-anchored protein